MTVLEAIEARHSVRQYTDKRIEGDVLTTLQEAVAACNKESGLHIQLLTDEPNAFDSFLAHYGRFVNVRNYFALIGKKSADLEEKAGYYGEQLVLLAQQLGLNTCWVALTFSKRKAKFVIDQGEQLVCVIALGYGATQGAQHKNRPIYKVCNGLDGEPDWYVAGMNAVLAAPTAINQQKFFFTREGNQVSAADKGGPNSKVDLGIVKYHFEQAAGKENFTWKE